MSYMKTTWQDGDVISAERLNNMENGIANAAIMFIVNITENNDEIVLDKTWQEIYNASENAIPVYIYAKNNNEYEGQGIFVDRVKEIYVFNNLYTVVTVDGNLYSTPSPSDYPQEEEA